MLCVEECSSEACFFCGADDCGATEGCALREGLCGEAMDCASESCWACGDEPACDATDGCLFLDGDCVEAECGAGQALPFGQMPVAMRITSRLQQPTRGVPSG